MEALINAVLLGVVALLPLINPPTTVALFISLSKGLTAEEKNTQALKAALYVLLIMLVTYYVGELVMRAFSISIPGLRIAGGGILVAIGYKMLFPTFPTEESISQKGEIKGNFAFIPLAMPSTAGPGTIAMILSSVATIRDNTYFPSWVLVVAPPLIFILSSFIVWSCLRCSGLLMRLLGDSGVDAISRIMGFILICMGVQFFINGFSEVAQILISKNS